MGVDLYLVPKRAAKSGGEDARSWLDREGRRFGELVSALDPAIEGWKRKLADLLLAMKPEFSEFKLRHEVIAEHEKITADEVRRKYRQIELNGPSVQFTIYDQHVLVGLTSKTDMAELDALLTAMASEGNLVLFDPQSGEVVDFGEESIG